MKCPRARLEIMCDSMGLSLIRLPVYAEKKELTVERALLSGPIQTPGVNIEMKRFRKLCQSKCSLSQNQKHRLLLCYVVQEIHANQHEVIPVQRGIE